MSDLSGDSGVFVVLMDWYVGHRLDEGYTWTQDGTYTNCWWTYRTEGKPETVKNNGEVYTERASISDCNANAKSWYFYSVDNKVYIHNDDGTSPEDEYPIVFFWEHISNHFCVVDGVPYEDLFKKESLKEISVSTSTFDRGGTELGFGSIEIINSGRFNSRFSSYVYEGQYIKLRDASMNPGVDLENMTASDFEVNWEGYSSNLTWDKDKITIDTLEYREILE